MKRILVTTLIGLICTAVFAQQPLWMRYPAISPNGETIVFSYKGDLYKTSAQGGSAIPLTMHEGHDFRPVWSHDGSRIAFASYRYGNYDIFVMPAAGGEAKQVTFHSANDYPSDFTPDNSNVIFSSSRKDKASNRQFPSGVLPELYQVPTDGGRVKQVLTTPAKRARFSDNGNLLIYHDQKGYEDKFRKHHTSSVTRDVWMYHTEADSFRMLTNFKGEDRNPVFAPEQESIYYLSEESGDFNVHKLSLDNAPQNQQLTNFQHHPVRHLTVSDGGVMCFSFHGELYTLREEQEPEKLDIQITTGERYNNREFLDVNSGASEMAVSPNGKQVAYIFRGEVFVSATAGKFTKRITNTPGQERSISFSPDGRSLLYAGERDTSWNIYETTISNEDEKFFFNATLLSEEPVLETGKETFQPAYSPDGKEIAYLEDRTTLKVLNKERSKSRVIMPGDMSYSYSDGDQHYQWAPDGKWFLVNFYPPKQWSYDVGLVKADGSGEVKNITQSGYSDNAPKWMLGGDMMIWFSDRHGMRSHGSWGSESDVYGMFFNKEAWEKFNLSEDEYKLLKEEQESEEKKNGDKDEDEEQKTAESLKITMEGLQDRKERLTLHSSYIADAAVGKEGTKLYYLARVDDNYDLWETNMRTRETKVLAKLSSRRGGELKMGPEHKKLFVLNKGRIFTIVLKSGKKESISMQGEMELKAAAERAYLFEHVWRQVREKFYVKDLHDVDWDFYKKEYKKFLPYINNNHDFAEMLSEMLGELNASHTGCRYSPRNDNDNRTAALGAFYDPAFEGNGLKILEIMDKSPLLKSTANIQPGHIIEKIDGTAITADMNYYPLLNRKAGDKVLLSIHDPETGKKWTETIEPISRGHEHQLRYERWVKMNEQRTRKLSDGKFGYVHIRGMNDRSFRQIYEKIIGKYSDKEALVVDTRFNGGGWLHDDLVTLLSGEVYCKLVPRGRHIASEPLDKWTRPTAVLMSESNYSDAHMFPYAYKTLGIGKLIGMPVPGTGTAVWWERLQDKTLVFGIPQIGVKDVEDDYLENKQLEPDIRVKNQPDKVANDVDQQLRKAVEVLLEQIED